MDGPKKWAVTVVTLANSYWTILETVPYSIANATHAQNQTLHATQLQTHGAGQQHLSNDNATNLITSATVVVELPPDDLGNPVGNIQYTIPALTKNATTNTNTSSLHKPQATTIQIVKQQHQSSQRQMALQHCIDTQSIVRQAPQQASQRQEYIKIDTSRLEDKMLLRDVMQYGSTSITVTPSSHPSSDVIPTTVVAHESELLLTNADDAERELELAAMKSDQNEGLLDEIDDDDDYVDKLPSDVTQQQQKIYVNGLTDLSLTSHGLQDINDLAGDDAKFVCNCGKSYKIKGSLKRHKNYECGVEPTLKCPHCPHKCKYKSDLRKHINQKHT